MPVTYTHITSMKIEIHGRLTVTEATPLLSYLQTTESPIKKIDFSNATLPIWFLEKCIDLMCAKPEKFSLTEGLFFTNLKLYRVILGQEYPILNAETTSQIINAQLTKLSETGMTLIEPATDVFQRRLNRPRANGHSTLQSRPAISAAIQASSSAAHTCYPKVAPAA